MRFQALKKIIRIVDGKTVKSIGREVFAEPSGVTEVSSPNEALAEVIQIQRKHSLGENDDYSRRRMH